MQTEPDPTIFEKRKQTFLSLFVFLSIVVCFSVVFFLYEKPTLKTFVPASDTANQDLENTKAINRDGETESNVLSTDIMKERLKEMESVATGTLSAEAMHKRLESLELVSESETNLTVEEMNRRLEEMQ